MNDPTPRNLPRSVLDRLRNRARQRGEDMNLLLVRYGSERLLYRLSRSSHADRFLLKGALLFLVWTGQAHRPTKDIDLLGFGDPSPEALRRLFQDVCSVEVAPDGVVFNPASVRVDQIREGQAYGGQRVRCEGSLDTARLRVQVDVGFGDAITPGSREAVLSPMLDFPPPVLRVYPKETVVAEKLDAIVQFGMANSRMKDYYDLWVLAREFEFDHNTLRDAIRATFDRRGTPLPRQAPVGLSDQFSRDRVKRAQWSAFVKASRLVDLNVTLDVVVEQVRIFVLPALLSED